MLYSLKPDVILRLIRGVAQLASARALGAWGRGFESRLPDFAKILKTKRQMTNKS